MQLYLEVLYLVDGCQGFCQRLVAEDTLVEKEADQGDQQAKSDEVIQVS